MQSVIDAITWIANWLAGGANSIVDFFKDAGTWLLAKVIISYIDTKIWMIQFFWGVAKSVLSDLHVFDEVAAALSSLPSDILAALNFFNVPRAINIILTAGMTRFVMNLMPFA